MSKQVSPGIPTPKTQPGAGRTDTATEITQVGAALNSQERV